MLTNAWHAICSKQKRFDGNHPPNSRVHGKAEIEMIVCQRRREGREDLLKKLFFKQEKLQQKDIR